MITAIAYDIKLRFISPTRFMGNILPPSTSVGSSFVPSISRLGLLLFSFHYFSCMKGAEPAAVGASHLSSVVKSLNRVNNFGLQSSKLLICRLKIETFPNQTSRSATSLLFCSINSRRGSTLSPIKMGESFVRKHCSSIVTRSIMRFAGTHCRVPKLFGVHFAQTFIALDVHFIPADFVKSLFSSSSE